MPTEALRLKDVEDTASRFAARHIEPVASELDHADPVFPELAFSQGLEAGFDRFVLPESAGGYGFSTIELGALITALARTCAGHAAVFGVHAAIINSIHEAGSENKNQLLETIFTSRRPVATVIPDPLSPTEFETDVLAEPREPGRFSIDGCAGLAINVALAGYCVAFAKDRQGQPSAFLVKDGDAGVIIGPPEFALGLRAMPMAEVKFSDFPAPAAQVIAVGDQAMNFYRGLLANLSLIIAAAAGGIMQAARKKAMQYANERYQGGVMIIDHPHLRNILGAMAAAETAMDGAILKASTRAPDFPVALGTKIVTTEATVRLCTDAVQILGGYGYMRDFGLEKRMRDAAVLALLPISNPRAELLLAAIEKEKLA